MRHSALMHLAMTALWPLTQPKQAAYRLFMADALMKAGMTTREVWHALGFDSALIERIEKYSPDQPRVPAGNGRPSGQWTRDGAENAPVPGRSAGSGARNDRPSERNPACSQNQSFSSCPSARFPRAKKLSAEGKFFADSHSDTVACRTLINCANSRCPTSPWLSVRP